MIVFTQAMATVAARTQSGTTLRVLMLLPEHLNFVDFRPLNQRGIAAQLQVGTGSVSRAMAELLEMGVVERQGRGPVTTWRLSSDWGWNGTVDQFHAFRAGRLKNKAPPAGHPKVAEGILPRPEEERRTEPARQRPLNLLRTVSDRKESRNAHS